MIEEIQELFWWKVLRKDVSEFVSKCLVCERVKFERKKSSYFNLYLSQIGNGILYP